MARAQRAGAGWRIPTTPLVVTIAFGPRLPAPRVAEAIARGLAAEGLAPADLCPIPGIPGRAAEISAQLDALRFDARMRPARAVVLGEPSLTERTLAGSAAFEIATRARQAGVPAYAVTAANRLDSFDARILDLQVILVAGSARALTAAGRELAALLR